MAKEKPNEVSTKELRELVRERGVVLYDVKGAAWRANEDFCTVHMDLGLNNGEVYSHVITIEREAHDALNLEGKLYMLNTELDRKD